MMDLNEKHFCINCNQELTEDEAYDTFDGGCKHCKGFSSIEGTPSEFIPHTSYLDLYLQSLNNFQSAY